MSALAQLRRQTQDLVRLRQVRMRVAQRALAEARAATLAAERTRLAADAAARLAADAQGATQAQLSDDPGEAGRLLAILDRRRFESAVAAEAFSEARGAEQAALSAEADRRKAMILAQARHDVLDERLALLRRRAMRAEEERAALDAEDSRRAR